MQLTLISGRSGSGKSTVLHVLEDHDFYCIDNLPASLLPSLARRLTAGELKTQKVAVSIDARNLPADLEQVPAIIDQLSHSDLATEVLFLDANSQTLLKRFSESRRKHPLSDKDTGLREAIDRESEMLEPLSLMASLSIDTSEMSQHTLRDLIVSRLLNGESKRMTLQFQSFGFKNGIALDADLVFDVRCLPNPYWDSSLRALTGLNSAVQAFLDSQPEVQAMSAEIEAYLDRWLPRFERNNRSYMTVALGCTGGQHRSVYLAEKLGQLFQERFAQVQVRHRELGSELLKGRT
jgi:UPF0042 nucleotide-binding protein